MVVKEIHSGSEVDSICTRCKTLAGHVVVAMVGSTIVKVKCNVCGSEHKFKSPVVEKKAPAVTRNRASASAKSATGQSDDFSDYRPKSKPARAVASARPRGQGKNGPTPEEIHAQAMAGKEGQEARDYSAREAFSIGELVQHPSFGVGVVMATRDGNKFDAIFPSGEKTLVHRR